MLRPTFICRRTFLQACLVLGVGLAVSASGQEATPHRLAAFQVALDRRLFSPGCVDDHLGPQTRAALRAWQNANALPVTGDLDDATTAKLTLDVPAITTYEITAGDMAQLGTAPDGWRARAAQDRMPYESLLELLAERFHATQRFLRALNPEVDWTKLAPPATVQVPNVLTDDTLPKASQVRISLAQKWLAVYDADSRICAYFPCSIGRDKLKRPTGALQIVKVAPHPNYTFDPKVFPESAEAQTISGKLIIPPGPNNPVGVMWLTIGRAPGNAGPPLTGYGLHGTPKPEDIGKTESHGCFRLANWNVERLGAMISIGTPVIVNE